MGFWWLPIVLGIVEGLTEFLPVSSTGHLIVAGYALGFTGEFANTFEIAIQLGSILAVVVYFRERLADMVRRFPTDAGVRVFAAGVALAFLPAALVGFVAHGAIKTYLFTPKTVAFALIAGGVAILLIEARPGVVAVTDLEAVRPRTALWVGLAQCLALFPGVSRAGATIMGGLVVGMDRKTSSEFSFFLALPTMFAATLYDAYKSRALLAEEHALWLGLGLTAAFVTALAVIALFMTFIKRHTFRVFAYYRIVFGLVVLFLFWT
ncbi:MAG: undecaprenyl-diphosphate phosphatase [Nitrospirae bacterium]|nr:undecaprenyl-diphosphate phosphatase [Nitrospirota bacterium]